MAFLRNELGQIIRKDGSVVERAGKGRSSGPRKTPLEGGRISHLKVDRILGPSGPLRDEYEKLLDDPNTFVKDLEAWFAGKGHHVNRAAINKHRRRRREQFKQVREAAEMAAAFCEITRKQGGQAGSFVEAAQGHFEMKLMQNLSRMGDNPNLPPQEWQAWGKALRDAATTRRTVEETRAEYERRAAEAVKAVEQSDPADSHEAVVKRVRDILGVNLPVNADA